MTGEKEINIIPTNGTSADDVKYAKRVEEIYIDGVNVAGCYWKCKDGDCAMYYADLSADNNELEFSFNCEDNPDCYYKQLKRLEQERDKLIEFCIQLDKAKSEQHLQWQQRCTEIRNEDLKQIDELKQENKQIKKDVQLFKCLDTFGESECHCACRCLGNEFCEDADKKINTYRSALEEIRNLVKGHKIADEVRLKSILDKIEEVLGC